MPLTVELVTPTRAFVREEVDAVSVPTPLGEITILPHHVPLLATLAAGELKLRTEDGEQSFAVAGGIVQVLPGSRIHILADVAERAEEVFEEAAEEAKRRAEELRSKAVADDVAFAGAAAAVERELARIRVARKFRHRGRHGPSRGSLPASSVVG